jgi:hypothetical protein
MAADRSQIQQAVGASVAAIGVGHLLAPVASGRFWGLAPNSAAVVPHLTRLYGATLAGLGVLTMQDRSGSPLAVQVATGVGGATAVLGLLGGVSGRVGWRGAVMTIVTAGGLAGLAGAAARTP